MTDEQDQPAPEQSAPVSQPPEPAATAAPASQDADAQAIQAVLGIGRVEGDYLTRGRDMTDVIVFKSGEQSQTPEPQPPPESAAPEQ